MPIENKTCSFDRQLLQQCGRASQRAARLGGQVLMEMLGQAESWQKGPGDWVTQADFKSQQLIRRELLQEFPHHDFLGEEVDGEINVSDKRQPADFCWIVDPLDGTTNFVHQLRSFSVSVGLLYRNPRDGTEQLLAGTVFDPTTNECFSAIVGQGATLNDGPIRVSQCTTLSKALMVHSMNSRVQRQDPQITRLLNVMATAATVRRLGSAALNLCFVACGRMDAYWATNLSAWDVAAGWLIASEAGAVVADFDNQPLQLMHPKFCCAATTHLFAELQPLLGVNPLECHHSQG